MRHMCTRESGLPVPRNGVGALLSGDLLEPHWSPPIRLLAHDQNLRTYGGALEPGKVSALAVGLPRERVRSLLSRTAKTRDEQWTERHLELRRKLKEEWGMQLERADGEDTRAGEECERVGDTPWRAGVERALAEEKRKKAEEERKKAEEERKRAEEERKKAEEERKQAEEERKQAEERLKRERLEIQLQAEDAARSRQLHDEEQREIGAMVQALERRRISTAFAEKLVKSGITVAGIEARDPAIAAAIAAAQLPLSLALQLGYGPAV